MSMLNENTTGYDEIKFRSEALSGLIQYTDIVEKESELLYWSTLTPEQLHPIIDKLIEEAKLQEELRKKEEKKLARENEGGNELDKAGMNADMTINNQDEKQLWYFYNPQLVSQGVRAFKQKWGNRELKDYWRFSNTISSLMSDSFESDSMLVDSLDMEGNLELNDSIAGNLDMTEEMQELSTDPTTREYYIQQIPVTDEQKESSHKALREALLEAGIRF